MIISHDGEVQIEIILNSYLFFPSIDIENIFIQSNFLMQTYATTATTQKNLFYDFRYEGTALSRC